MKRVLSSRIAGIVAVLVLGALAAVALAGSTSRTVTTVGVGSVEFRVHGGGDGRTALVLPPLGRVTARTHARPASLTAEVKTLDLERLGDLAETDDPASRARAEAAAAAERVIPRVARRLLLLSALVGALTAVIVPRRRWYHVPAGAVGGILGASLLLGSVWYGYDVSKFESDPRFEGPLERAPAVLETVRRHIDDVDVVRSRVGTLGARIAELYTAVDGTTHAEPGTAILHVSDIHSNPLAIEVVRRLVESFGVDAVLDTGDLTSFGSPIEARIVDLIRDSDVPYLLIPGNHDSPPNRRAFDEVAEITVLDRDTVTIGSVEILGVADPTFTADNETSTEEANDRKVRSAPSVARLVRRTDPDLLAVHDLRQAAEVAGDVPLVVAGHTHERSQRREESTLLLTVGSTGATGLGSFTTDTDLAYEAQILRFAGGQLVAIDYISLPGFDGSFTVQHSVVTHTGDATVPHR
jgi:predicted phosphodiesterase